MTITVGTDTYATITEADAYLALFYLSTNAQFIIWDALSDADKEVVLRNATKSLERLQWIGEKYDTDQTLFFPRVIANPLPNRRWGDYRQDQEQQTYRPESPSVPDSIKYAQIEEALELASPSTDTDKFDAMNSGVKSERTGDHSVSYSANAIASGVNAIIRSFKSRDYIAPFMSGGYAII